MAKCSLSLDQIQAFAVVSVRTNIIFTRAEGKTGRRIFQMENYRSGKYRYLPERKMHICNIYANMTLYGILNL